MFSHFKLLDFRNSNYSACPNKREVASGTTVISATSNELKVEIIIEDYRITVSEE